MKINELSKLMGIKPETIRMYRKKGFLKPQKNPNNGYYEYSEKDAISLFMIRKMRGNDFSLKAIYKMYTSDDLTELINDFEMEKIRVNAEIQRLQSQIEVLQMEIQHLEECYNTGNGMALLNSTDSKYDLYDFYDRIDHNIQKWINNTNQSTIPLLISGEVLSGPLPEHVPVKVGIGTYGSIIKKLHLPMPEGLVVNPPGLYLTMLLRLSQLDYIERAQLMPLQQYVADHHMRFVGNTTAYLMRIDMSGEIPVFIFRIRIRVEEKS